MGDVCNLGKVFLLIVCLGLKMVLIVKELSLFRVGERESMRKGFHVRGRKEGKDADAK